MKPIGIHNYFVYFTTNRNRKVLYIGVTNELKNRLWEHKNEFYQKKITFARKYKCYYLIYFEQFDYIEQAIDREKQFKKWSRKKKENLINMKNPNWRFLNEIID